MNYDSMATRTGNGARLIRRGTLEKSLALGRIIATTYYLLVRPSLIDTIQEAPTASDEEPLPFRTCHPPA